MPRAAALSGDTCVAKAALANHTPAAKFYQDHMCLCQKASLGNDPHLGLRQNRYTMYLDLGLVETVLPEHKVRRHTILTVVQQGNHTLRVHRLTREELPV